MLEFKDGWLFVGKDALLYFVSMDRGPYFNGWDVSQIYPEWWGRAYPVDEG